MKTWLTLHVSGYEDNYSLSWDKKKLLQPPFCVIFGVLWWHRLSLWVASSMAVGNIKIPIGCQLRSGFEKRISSRSPTGSSGLNHSMHTPTLRRNAAWSTPSLTGGRDPVAPMKAMQDNRIYIWFPDTDSYASGYFTISLHYGCGVDQLTTDHL